MLYLRIYSVVTTHYITDVDMSLSQQPHLLHLLFSTFLDVEGSWGGDVEALGTVPFYSS